MSKKKTSNTVIVDTILATGMTHAEAAELFDVNTAVEPTSAEILDHYTLQESRKYHPNQLHK